MTGLNPARHRVTNWTLRVDQENSGTTDRLAAPPDWRREGLQPGGNTLPLALKSAGYRTIHVGKAHWGAIGTPGADPRNLGFDVNIAGHSAGAPGSYQGEDHYDKPGDDGQPSVWAVPGLDEYKGTETHLTEALAAKAVAAIESAVKDRQPFFLYLAPYAVHTPIQPHASFIDHYRGRVYPGTEIPIPEVEACYASMVEGMDAALGSVMESLRRNYIADRTIIVFTSDNGGLSAHAREMTAYGTGDNTHNHPLREGKGSAYEGGTRVPLVISWATPDSGSPLQQRIPIEADSISHVPVISEDLMPTICGWAGANPRAAGGDNAAPIDGRDLGDVPSGNADPGDRAILFHYPHVWGPRGGGYQPHSSIRMGRWKVIYFYDQELWELYRLDKDPGESNNLAESEPERLRELAARLVAELESREALYPLLRGTDQPVKPRLPSESIVPRPARSADGGRNQLE